MKIPLARLAVFSFVFLSAVESRGAVGTVAAANPNSSGLIWGGGTLGIVDSLRVTIGYTNTPLTTIFGQFTFHTNDVGRVFSIDQSNDPGFLPFLARATNGTLDRLTVNFFEGGTGIGMSPLETEFFISFSNGNNGIDLRGFQIQRIDLVLNGLSFVSPGSNPAGDGNWTDSTWNISVLFIGVVPEASAAAILGCGILVMFFRTRSKRARTT